MNVYQSLQEIANQVIQVFFILSVLEKYIYTFMSYASIER